MPRQPANVFFDTSVLVAASVRSHPHHARAFSALESVMGGKYRGSVSTHTLAELYSVLTRLPIQPAIHPSEAHRIVDQNILAHFDIVPLDLNDYREVIREAAAAGWTGGRTYDLLLLRCAQKKSYDLVFTFNVIEFRQLAPAIQDRICAP